MQAHFRFVHPVLGARNVAEAVSWYVEKLGFRKTFDDGGDPVLYAGVKRDDVEIHLQWHDVASFAAEDGDCPAYRFEVDDPDALFEEYRTRGVLREGMAVRDTPWGTREFGVHDPNGMALAFYRARI